MAASKMILTFDKGYTVEQARDGRWLVKQDDMQVGRFTLYSQAIKAAEKAAATPYAD